MLLIVGLGNPGKEYEQTRHNAGWLFLDFLASLPESDFDGWKEKKKLNCLVSEGSLSFVNPRESASSLSLSAVMAKPLTFMNNSGIAVQKLVAYYSLPSTLYARSLMIAHDDMDIPFGEFKIQTNRGPAGHHGVESVMKNLGTKNFTRVRVGIAPKRRTKASEHVMKRFSKEEWEHLPKLFKTIYHCLMTAHREENPHFDGTAVHPREK